MNNTVGEQWDQIKQTMQLEAGFTVGTQFNDHQRQWISQESLCLKGQNARSLIVDK